jgi:hypothetical protein
MGMRTDMKTRGITGIDGVGIVLVPRCASMVTPCCTENVCSCAILVFIKIVLAMMGIILIIIFTSSTWVTVQTFQGCGSVPSLRIAALSSNLFRRKQSTAIIIPSN